MKKVTFTTKPSDHITILRNGLAIYSCHETNGHKIDLFVPDHESEFEFDSSANKMGRSRMASKIGTTGPSAA